MYKLLPTPKNELDLLLLLLLLQKPLANKKKTSMQKVSTNCIDFA
jgi:hypothetical protein